MAPSSWAPSASWGRGPCWPRRPEPEPKLLWEHIPGPGRLRAPWAAGPAGDLGPECRELKAGWTSEAHGAGSPEASLPPRPSRQAWTQAGPSPPPRVPPSAGLAPLPLGAPAPGPRRVSTSMFFLFSAVRICDSSRDEGSGQQRAQPPFTEGLRVTQTSRAPCPVSHRVLCCLTDVPRGLPFLRVALSTSWACVSGSGCH